VREGGGWGDVYSRVLEGLRGKVEAGVEDEVWRRDEGVGGIISVVGTVDV